MTKHTEGPWETDEIDHDDFYQDILVRSSNTHRTICRIWIDDAPVEDYNRTQWANAGLIASAPDLLNTLRELLDFSTPDTHPRNRERAENARKQAVELLKKFGG